MNAHIIIVNFNAGDWLKRAVRSALEHSQAMVSVVDNASSDHSMQGLKQEFANESRLDFIQNEDNLGFAAANNQVLSRLDHEFAVLMNPDCELQAHSLERILSVMQDDKEIGIASCRILNADGSLQNTCKRRFPTPQSALLRMLGLSRFYPQLNFDFGATALETDPVETLEAVSGAFMVVRASAVDEVGLLDQEYFMHCEDLDWCKRFALAGWKVNFVPAAVVTHAKGVSSQARPLGVLWNLHRGMDRFFTKFYAHTSWPLKVLVKIAIYLSFLPRAALALIRR